MKDEHIALRVEDDRSRLLDLLARAHELGQFPFWIDSKLESIVPSVTVGWEGERLCLGVYYTPYLVHVPSDANELDQPTDAEDGR